MTRIIKKIALENPDVFSQKLLIWAQSSPTFLWLDSNDYPQKYSSFNKMLALGVKTALQSDYHNAFHKLDVYQQQTKDYLFGYFTYDLKNDTEVLNSTNFDGLEFPDLFFFQALKIFIIKDNFLEILYDTSCESELKNDLEQIRKTKIEYQKNKKKKPINQRISESAYYQKLKTIKQHINRGDSYELNFCMEFYQEEAEINPLSTYRELNRISTPPFATFFKHKSHYILSASPERFVRKQGNKIISQPIKGTAKRSPKPNRDKLLQQELLNNPKERSENIMIVDLVRNDLSKTARKNSVQVEELCKIYSFKQVHQLISTVTSELKKEITPVQLIKSLFPMGSMTGAPKISSMKIIEEQERTKRGVYSGSVGYFTPDDDFDFNVIIRSILYNKDIKYLSYSVGGAITAKSDIKKEYEECLIKAAAMRQVIE